MSSVDVFIWIGLGCAVAGFTLALSGCAAISTRLWLLARNHWRESRVNPDRDLDWKRFEDEVPTEPRNVVVGKPHEQGVWVMLVCNFHVNPERPVWQAGHGSDDFVSFTPTWIGWADTDTWASWSRDTGFTHWAYVDPPEPSP